MEKYFIVKTDRYIENAEVLREYTNKRNAIKDRNAFERGQRGANNLRRIEHSKEKYNDRFFVVNSTDFFTDINRGVFDFVDQKTIISG